MLSRNARRLKGFAKSGEVDQVVCSATTTRVPAPDKRAAQTATRLKGHMQAKRAAGRRRRR